MVLEPYDGEELSSCTSKINIVGQIRLCKAVFSNNKEDILENIVIIVKRNDSAYECLLGRYLLCLIPSLSKRLTATRNLVKRISKKVERIYTKIKNSPYVKSIEPVNSVNSVELTNDQILQKVEENIKKNLQTIAAEKLTELTPYKNSRVASKSSLLIQNKNQLDVKSVQYRII